MSSWVQSHLHLCHRWALKLRVLHTLILRVALRMNLNSWIFSFQDWHFKVQQTRWEPDPNSPPAQKGAPLHRVHGWFDTRFPFLWTWLFSGQYSLWYCVLSVPLFFFPHAQDNQPAATRRADDGDSNLWWECFPPCFTFTFIFKAFSEHCLSKSTYNRKRVTRKKQHVTTDRVHTWVYTCYRGLIEVLS